MFNLGMPVWLQFLVAVAVAFFSVWWTRKVNRGKPKYRLTEMRDYTVLADAREHTNLLILQAHVEGEGIFLFCPKDYKVDRDIKKGSKFFVSGNELLID